MANLVVIVYDDPNGAEAMRNSIQSIEKLGRIRLDDSAVLVKDAAGKVHVQNQMDRGVKVGAVGGGAIGLLLASVFFPVAGIVIGAIGGALVGASMDLGVSKKFVKDVADDLQPNSSALFLLVRDADPTLALAALRQHEGTGRVYHTTLSDEDEKQLREAVEKGHG